MKSSLLAAIVLLGLGGTAFAADAISTIEPTPAPLPVASSYIWSGAYIGLEAGYGWGKSHHFTEVIPASTDKFTIDGALGGLTLGYNYQVDRWVFGAETDISAADLHGRTDTIPGWGCGTGCQTKVDWFGTVRARAGIAFDTTLPYITGGLAYGHVKGYIDEAPAYSGTGTSVGWTIGGGVEHALTDHFSVKAEYLYVDLGKIKIENFGSFGQGYADAKFSTARIGLNYKF